MAMASRRFWTRHRTDGCDDDEDGSMRRPMVAMRSAARLPITPPNVPAAAIRPYDARAPAGSNRSATSDQKPDNSSALAPARWR
jgi:hypothetical protein